MVMSVRFDRGQAPHWTESGGRANKDSTESDEDGGSDDDENVLIGGGSWPDRYEVWSRSLDLLGLRALRPRGDGGPLANV